MPQTATTQANSKRESGPGLYVPVTPSDDTDIAGPCIKWLRADAAGVVKFLAAGQADGTIFTVNMVAGEIISGGQIRRVLATGTTVAAGSLLGSV